MLSSTIVKRGTQSIQKRKISSKSAVKDATGNGSHVAKWSSPSHKADLFVHRHMDFFHSEPLLKELGFTSLDTFTEAVIPKSIRRTEPFLQSLPELGYTESRATAILERMAEQNPTSEYSSFMGGGYYGTLTPNAIRRNIIENPEWYTPYTPYQAEISQGRLESLLNFQTMVSELTAMEVANASLLDESTAAAEAANLMIGVSTKGDLANPIIFVSEDVLPQTINVIQTRCKITGVKVVVGDASKLNMAEADLVGIVVGYPDAFGRLKDWSELVASAKKNQVLTCATADLMACVNIKPPGEVGFDIVVGSAQRFGVPLGGGGPHAAFMATRAEYKRALPGRIIGVSRDAQGNRALRMALQTREQHIRREKATSNICTAQALLANVAAMYAVYHGPKGLRSIASAIATSTRELESEIVRCTNYKVDTSEAVFDTITLVFDTNKLAHEFVTTLKSEKKLVLSQGNRVMLTVSETTTPADLDSLLKILIELNPATTARNVALKEPVQRTSTFMQQSVFNSYHTETEFMRYAHKLQLRDISLLDSMIPLGSCTMKLNAASEMYPISFPGFAAVHPYTPDELLPGYKNMIDTLAAYLADITGLDQVSFQSNAGSQGEYSGLLSIQGFHKANGQGARDICLIPTSAHGTNPASAAMVGLKVETVRCDELGNVDVEDLRAKALKHSARLACLMITYPSTHGVFESKIQDITKIIHDAGGLVYMDGANMNAQVGLMSPGELGADVVHLNLHKTFCIPHGGGGPGMGPIVVRQFLNEHLPGDPRAPESGAISGANWSSASILPIPLMYILMMGKSLKMATQMAILNANYMAKRLGEHYPILYKGTTGYVAHEFILDFRHFKATTGIEVEDVAKRLMDYGFHAPTMSFPVAGTLMIEPTESESKYELDRFCDALINIRKEIGNVEKGVWPKDSNPLKLAPHTHMVVTGDEWTRSYPRSVAAYPMGVEWSAPKFWPSVGRVDNVYGDRNFCSCLPPSDALPEK